MMMTLTSIFAELGLPQLGLDTFSLTSSFVYDPSTPDKPLKVTSPLSSRVNRSRVLQVEPTFPVAMSTVVVVSDML